jgi:hypothetical protein
MRADDIRCGKKGKRGDTWVKPAPLRGDDPDHHGHNSQSPRQSEEPWPLMTPFTSYQHGVM